MFCNQCGAELAGGIERCSVCGKAPGAPVVAAPGVAAPAGVGRVAKHRNFLGLFWLIWGIISLPGGLVLIGLSRFHPWTMGGPWGEGWPNAVQHIMPTLASTMGYLLLTISVLTIMAGVGLLQKQSWARVLAIVMGILRLLDFPFGTALGIYTLWVLVPAQSDAEYAALARVQAG
ncbi:MAG: DUF7144 family membrane protein [Terriglobales bacterium]